MKDYNKKALFFFPTSITKKKATDTGMAFVLILLLIGFFTKNNFYYKLSIPFLIVNMTYPNFYYYPAVIWLGLTELLGALVSKVILSIIYIIIVLPVSIFRKMIGKDTLQLKEFKKNRISVLKNRNHLFSDKDIKNPY